MPVTLVHLNDTTTYYTFSAASLLEAHRCITTQGPSDGDGHHAATCDVRADIMIGLQTGLVSGSAMKIQELDQWAVSAQITRGELRYGAIYVYPRWSNVERLPRYVQAEWDRFMRALQTHEQGHLREAMPFLNEFKNRFEALRIMGSAPQRWAAEAQALANIMDQIRDLNRELSFRCQRATRAYDRRTRHGRSQGAQLRTRITTRRARRS